MTQTAGHRRHEGHRADRPDGRAARHRQQADAQRAVRPQQAVPVAAGRREQERAEGAAGGDCGERAEVPPTTTTSQADHDDDATDHHRRPRRAPTATTTSASTTTTTCRPTRYPDGGRQDQHHHGRTDLGLLHHRQGDRGADHLLHRGGDLHQHPLRAEDGPGRLHRHDPRRPGGHRHLLHLQLPGHPGHRRRHPDHPRVLALRHRGGVRPRAGQHARASAAAGG